MFRVSLIGGLIQAPTTFVDIINSNLKLYFMVQFMPFLHMLQYKHTVTWITYVHCSLILHTGKKVHTMYSVHDNCVQYVSNSQYAN